MTTTTDNQPENAEEPMPTNVVAALARVQAELPAIGKDQVYNAPGTRYTYRGIEDITAHAQRLFGRYGIVWVPRVLKRKTVHLTVNGKPWTEEQLKVEYTVYGPRHGHSVAAGLAGDSIIVGPVWGLGRDNADKGTNKAMTQAWKYALIQTLCVGDSKDDADSERHETDGPSGDELARRDGWQDVAECQLVRSQVYERLATLVKRGTIDKVTARRTWDEYQEPGGEQRPRSRLEHQEFVQLHSLEPLVEPEPAEAPQEPGPAQDPAALPLQQTAQAPPPSGSVEATASSPAPDPAWDSLVGDNGFRDTLDEVHASGNAQVTTAAIEALSLYEVADGLVARGAAPTGGTPVEMRALLLQYLDRARYVDQAPPDNAARAGGRTKARR